MRFTIFTILATGASLVAAQEVPDTTTLTSTTTRVITLTECNPTVTDCPYRTTTSTEVLVETTTSEEPTTSEETTSEEPTSIYVPPPTTTSVYVPPTTTSIELPPVVNTTTSVITSSSTKVSYTHTHTPSIKTTFYPAGNTTTKAGPTAPVTRTTKITNVPGTDVVEIPTQATEEGSSPSNAAPPAVPTGAANGLVAQSGLAGVAIMVAIFAMY